MIPFVYSAGVPATTTSATTITLAANGGTVAIPLPCDDVLWAQSITVRTHDTSLPHTIEIIFALDAQGSEQIGGFQTFTYTGTGVVVRIPPLSSPIYLPAGLNWLIARNAGVNPSILTSIATGTLGGNIGATALIGASLSGGLGAPVWTPVTAIPLIRVSGSLGGILPGATI